jgi:hypothetical protein
MERLENGRVVEKLRNGGVHGWRVRETKEWKNGGTLEV